MVNKSLLRSATIRRIFWFVLLILNVEVLGASFEDLVPKAPRLDARSYLLFDATTGVVLAEENAHERMDPASLTKIMTVFVAAMALENGSISLEDETVVSEKAWKMEGSRMFIEVNKRVTVDDLLSGIIIQSGNDASVALAEYIAGDEDVFAQEMTAVAKQLGMTNSSFSNSTGLTDPETYVTAYDMAILSAALIKRFPKIYDRFKIRDFAYNDIKQLNRNRLLARDDSVDGIKTGFTDAAGYCLVASAQRGSMRLVSAVMGTASDEHRTNESSKLLNYGFRYFENKQVYQPGDPVSEIKVWKGEIDHLKLTVSSTLTATIPRGKYPDVTAHAEIPESLTAPVEAGQVVGKVTLTLADAEIASVPIVAERSVAEASFFGRMIDEVKMRID